MGYLTSNRRLKFLLCYSAVQTQGKKTRCTIFPRGQHKIKLLWLISDLKYENFRIKNRIFQMWIVTLDWIFGLDIIEASYVQLCLDSSVMRWHIANQLWTCTVWDVKLDFNSTWPKFWYVTYFLFLWCTVLKFGPCAWFWMSNWILISAGLDFDDVAYFLFLWCTVMKFRPCKIPPNSLNSNALWQSSIDYKLKKICSYTAI